eukprot:sb/3466529/
MRIKRDTSSATGSQPGGGGAAAGIHSLPAATMQSDPTLGPVPSRTPPTARSITSPNLGWPSRGPRGGMNGGNKAATVALNPQVLPLYHPQKKGSGAAYVPADYNTSQNSPITPGYAGALEDLGGAVPQDEAEQEVELTPGDPTAAKKKKSFYSQLSLSLSHSLSLSLSLSLSHYLSHYLTGKSCSIPVYTPLLKTLPGLALFDPSFCEFEQNNPDQCSIVDESQMKKVRSLSLTASTLSSHLSAVRRTASLSPVTPSVEEDQLLPSLPENGVSPTLASVSMVTALEDEGGEVVEEEGPDGGGGGTSLQPVIPSPSNPSGGNFKPGGLSGDLENSG